MILRVSVRLLKDGMAKHAFFYSIRNFSEFSYRTKILLGIRTACIRKMTVVTAVLRRTRQMPQCDRRRREFRRRNSFVPFSQGGDNHTRKNKF